jgi:hypothetical protein
MASTEQAIKLVLPTVARLYAGAEPTKPPPLLGEKGYKVVSRPKQ